MVSSQVDYLQVNIRMDGRCLRKERPTLKNQRVGHPPKGGREKRVNGRDWELGRQAREGCEGLTVWEAGT
jgi:hypothetical protein